MIRKSFEPIGGMEEHLKWLSFALGQQIDSFPATGQLNEACIVADGAFREIKLLGKERLEKIQTLTGDYVREDLYTYYFHPGGQEIKRDTLECAKRVLCTYKTVSDWIERVREFRRLKSLDAVFEED